MFSCSMVLKANFIVFKLYFDCSVSFILVLTLKVSLSRVGGHIMLGWGDFQLGEVDLECLSGNKPRIFADSWLRNQYERHSNA
jgi:hypothetical protein